MASAASIALQLQKLSNEATQKSFTYNSAESEKSRAWQKEMSDTSYQRVVKDLKAAGLNPVLGYNSGGAASYTTSSASAQAENAANAVGNVWSSQIGADATRAAAAQSAAAMRYSAAQNAAAQRYAASLQYEAAMEGYNVTREGYKNQKEVATIQNQKSLWGNLRQMFESNGVKNKDFTEKFAYKAENIRNDDTGKYVINKDKGLTFNNINWRTRQYLQSALRSTGLDPTLYNQKLAFNALIKQNKASVSLWNHYVQQMKHKSTSAYKKWSRSGSGIW